MSAVATSVSLSREWVILNHLPQVRITAARFHRRCPPEVLREDLVSAGTLGLPDAYRRFDMGRNLRFKTLNIAFAARHSTIYVNLSHRHSSGTSFPPEKMKSPDTERFQTRELVILDESRATQRLAGRPLTRDDHWSSVLR